MDKQLAQHRTQEQGSRIVAAAHLNYEFAMYRVGLKIPKRWPLLCAFRPASAFPRDSASSCLNPNRSATTEAQRVNTGARLIRILFDVNGQAKLKEFTVDAGRTPGRIGAIHLANQEDGV
jgi:hypothetical protein